MKWNGTHFILLLIMGIIPGIIYAIVFYSLIPIRAVKGSVKLLIKKYKK